jgi:NAD(P)-dependent dehydrogenase (short-subunit alcohol dehydrogenase family)
MFRTNLMTKTILITGATDGIGLLTAKKLAADGHRVLLHGRSQSKLEQAQSEVGNGATSFMADLSRLHEVESLAQAVSDSVESLDVLINNAGVLKAPRTITDDGCELRFVVNTLAPYLLTRRLLPIIPVTGRIVNLSSAAQAPFNPDVMLGKAKLADDLAVYAQSKLGITVWTQELARELDKGPVVVAVNPGSLLASKMVKEGFGMEGNDLSIGADILINAALHESFAGASGRYYDNDARQFAPVQADGQQCDKVMQTLHALLEPD